MAKISQQSGSVGPVVSGASTPVSVSSPPIGPVITTTTTGADVDSPAIGPVIARAHPSIVVRAGTLGCGVYRAAIRPRGGGMEVARIDWTGIDYSRVFSATSDITVKVAGVTSCSDDCPDWRALRPWRHELVVYRDTEEVASGPVVTPDLANGAGQIVARDMSGWLMRRVLHSTLTPGDAEDLAGVAHAIVTDAMQPDPSPGLVARWVAPVGIGGAPPLGAYTQLSSDALANLVQSGLAWLCIGREILVGPVNMWGDEIVATLRDGDFAAPPDVLGDGASQANAWIVIPQNNASGDPILGYHSDPVAASEDGLLEAVSTNSVVVVQADADKVAALYVSETAVTPRIVSGGTLARDAPIPIEDLWPGRVFTINVAGCYPAVQQLRLASVGVSATPAAETVAVTFMPLIGLPS